MINVVYPTQIQRENKDERKGERERERIRKNNFSLVVYLIFERNIFFRGNVLLFYHLSYQTRHVSKSS